ncbi:MAG: porin [Desulfuromonadaceae bacterium]|nr:porin [Desulfuromonadaceae bacterium]
MKTLGIAVGLCLVMSQAGAVSAKSLEDVLKEKGVISEEDYQEVMKSAAVTYKPGTGINLTSADGKFSTSIGGFMQARYTLLNYDDANGAPAQQRSRTFEVKRAKLIVSGHAFSKDVTYNLTTNFSNISGGTTKNGGLLENAWINYKLIDELQVRAGQDKVQFGRQWLTPATALQFIDQSHVTVAFAPTYDTGVNLNGKIAKGLFTYSVGASGGLGQNYVRSTENNAFAARITVNPFGVMKNSESDVENSDKPLLSIGSSFYRNTVTESEASTANTNNSLGFLKKKSGWFALNNKGSVSATSKEEIDFNLFSVDTAFKWRGLSLTGEFMTGEGEMQRNNYKLHALGAYAQAGYMIIPKTVELAYRYAYLDPNRDAGNDHWVENSMAVSWYIKEHNLKLQADYTAIHKQSAIASTSGSQPTDDKQVRLQLQLVF